MGKDGNDPYSAGCGERGCAGGRSANSLEATDRGERKERREEAPFGATRTVAKNKGRNPHAQRQTPHRNASDLGPPSQPCGQREIAALPVLPVAKSSSVLERARAIVKQLGKNDTEAPNWRSNSTLVGNLLSELTEIRSVTFPLADSVYFQSAREILLVFG
jgi:hypothetical protein